MKKSLINVLIFSLKLCRMFNEEFNLDLMKELKTFKT